MDDASLVQALTQHLDGADPADVWDAPLDELVAGLLEDRLLDDERERAVEILSAHPSLRAVLARTSDALGTDVPGAATTTRAAPAFSFARGGAIAAAAVLLAFLVGTWWKGGGDTSGDVLLADVAALTRDAPEVFAGFAPFDTSAPSSPDVQRGGLRLRAPAGVVLVGRPRFVWDSPLSSGRYRIRVRAEDGSVPWEAEVEGTAVEWPASVAPLAAGGRFVWRVTSLDAAVVLSGARTFERASAETAARYEAGLASIRTRSKRSALLAAHWALHLGLRAEALAHLRDAGPGPDAAALRAALRAPASD